MTNAIITGVLSGKNQLIVKYEFKYDSETCKDKHIIAKKLDYKADYSKGNEIKIYAFKNSDGKILTAPAIY